MTENRFSSIQPVRPQGEIVVRPIPEYRAEQPLTEVYRDLKATFGVPWVGVIVQAVAFYQPFFVEAWRRFAPSAKTHYFERACDDLRLVSWEMMNDAYDIASQSDRLRNLGYSERELEQIRAVLDIFDYGNPKYLVLATAIKEGLIMGRPLGGRADVDRRNFMPRSPVYQIEPIPVMVEEHHAIGGLATIYADIKRTLELPFVNSDYKAMGRWPSYLQLAWEELKPCIGTSAYQHIRQRIHEETLAAVDALPHVYHMDREAALSVGLTGSQVEELIQVISLFQWLLSGLVLNVTHFKLAMTKY